MSAAKEAPKIPTYDMVPPLQGLMQETPLLISSLIEHAATFHPDAAVVSRLPDGGIHRTDWRGVRDDSCRVAT